MNFMAAQARTLQAIRKLEEIYTSVDQTRQRVDHLQRSGGQVIETVQQLNGFIHGQELRADSQRAQIRELKQAEEFLQHELVEAAKNHKVIEKLREQKLTIFKKEKNQREQNEINDIIVMRAKGRRA